MRQIEIDDEVFSHLQGHALPFVDTTPNLTLRRLFQLDGAIEKPISNKITSGKSKKKQPKASLPTLIANNLLQEGQEVILVDYQENMLQEYKAIIIGTSLKWKGQLYSMSSLAKKLLNKEGYSSSSVRGPTHWCTNDGISITNIWKKYLESSK